MTLAVAVVTADGIVVAADSRTSLHVSNPVPAGPIAPTAYRVASDFTHKVFDAEEVAVATFGEAFIDGRNVASHMAEFVATKAGSCSTPQNGAAELADFFGRRYDAWVAAAQQPAPPPNITALGFLVGGYGNGVGEVYEVSIPARTATLIATTANGGGAAWRGQTDVVTRMIRGSDLELLGRLAPARNQQAEFAALRPTLDELGYIIPFDKMNLQDAIDFALLCIRTTIDVQRLTLGTVANRPNLSWPGVGGPIEIATVTAVDKFAWVQRTAVQGERPSGLAEGGASRGR